MRDAGQFSMNTRRRLQRDREQRRKPAKSGFC